MYDLWDNCSDCMSCKSINPLQLALVSFDTLVITTVGITLCFGIEIGFPFMECSAYFVTQKWQKLCRRIIFIGVIFINYLR